MAVCNRNLNSSDGYFTVDISPWEIESSDWRNKYFDFLENDAYEGKFAIEWFYGDSQGLGKVLRTRFTNSDTAVAFKLRFG